MKKKAIIALCAIAVILPYIGMFMIKNHYDDKIAGYERVAYCIIDKGQFTLTAYDLEGDIIETFPVGCGKNYGNKKGQGDFRTPEGVFKIESIEEAANWSHDFNDGKGKIDGAYGPYFIRLNTGVHKGIGIHGTHLPKSIGTRCTEGCIRLRNDDVRRLKDLVYPGLTVIILPAPEDAIENAHSSK